MTTGMLNRRAGRMVIETLQRSGSGLFVVCPGARSSPLTAALDGATNVVVHHDERAAGFLALGHALATGRPACVVTTSGSAVANLHPSAVEAACSEVPLLLLTADRPPETIGTGANQTIDQRGIFGPTVRGWTSLPCPDDAGAPEVFRAQLEGIWRLAMEPPAGPVHINCPFREPLLAADDGLAWPAAPLPPPPRRDGCADAVVPEAGRGVVVVGRLDVAEQAGADEILRFAGSLGWPVFADPLSGVPSTPPVVAHADFLLAALRWPHPEAVVHLGGPVVSKRIARWIEPVKGERFLQVRSSPRTLDPLAQRPVRRTGDPIAFCRAHRGTARQSAWLAKWLEADLMAERWLAAALDRATLPSEPAVARAIVGTMPDGSGLFLGNSMPIRDADAFAAWQGGARRVFGNRGASGIDGNIATAAGIALGSKAPTLALLGDLAALHDAGSLALVSALGAPLVLVVVNNGGAAIFRFLDLPVPALVPLWEAPHRHSLAAIAAGFGIAACQAGSLPDLHRSIASAIASGRPALIEVASDPDANKRLHEELTEGFAAHAANLNP